MASKRALTFIRSLLFYCGYAPLTAWFSVTGILLFRWPWLHRFGHGYISGWNRCVVWWLRITCGLSYRVIGADNIPTVPHVVLAKHQSQWETYFLLSQHHPACFVLKQELLSLPFFGWGLRLTDPIPIDRNNPKQAMKVSLEEGKNRLARGKNLVIFPEGTRIPAGRIGKFARGGASIAVQSGAPIVPIAHNAGHFWPADKFLKFPGEITVIVGKPIATAGSDSRQLTEQAYQWMAEQMTILEGRAPQPL